MFRGLRFFLPALGVGFACLLASPPGAAAAVQPPDYVIVDSFPAGVFRISNATGSVSGPSLAGQAKSAVAITPDGKAAYVVAQGSVVPVRVSDGFVGTPIPVAGATAIAISPDGSLAYVAGSAGITPVRLSDGTPLTPIALTTPVVRSIVFTPDGASAYALGFDAGETTSFVTPISVGSSTARAAIPLGAFADSGARMAPDGATLYVVTHNGVGSHAMLFRLNVASDALRSPIDLGAINPPNSIVVSPDGTRLYYGYFTGTQEVVRSVNLATGAIGSPIQLPDGVRVADMAITPDGRTLYAVHSHANQLANPPAEVIPIDLATDTVGTPIVTDTNPIGPGGGALAITPDQAPVAALLVAAHCAGTATRFDARASSVEFGSIVRYAWNFGDRTSRVTTGPTVKHTYAKPGTYDVTVTETDSAGTSTTVVYGNQGVILNGGPSARVVQNLTIGACAVPPVRSSVVPPAQSSTVDSSLPVTGSNTPEALLTSGLLIAAGMGLTRVGRRRTRSAG